MASVRIPRSCESRAQPTHAILIARIFPRRPFWSYLEGKLLPCGALIDRAALWPTRDFPKHPLLLEYAGNDRSGHGHRRSLDIHILWRYDLVREEWIQIARFVAATAAELAESIRPLVIRHFARARPTNPEAAPQATARVLSALDRELDQLAETCDRRELLGMLHDRFTARLVNEGAALWDAGGRGGEERRAEGRA